MSTLPSLRSVIPTGYASSDSSPLSRLRLGPRSEAWANVCHRSPASCSPVSVPIQHQSCVSNASRPFFSFEPPSHICKGLLKYILFQSYESCS